MIYSAIWLALLAGFAISLSLRTPLKVDIIRDRGSLGREVEGRWVENVYRLQLINTSEAPMQFTIRADGAELGKLRVESDRATGELAPTSNRLLAIRVRVPLEQARQGTHKIRVTVQGGGRRGMSSR